MTRSPHQLLVRLLCASLRAVAMAPPCVLALLVLASPAALAQPSPNSQEVSVSVSTSPQKVFFGDSFRLAVTVQGSRDVQPPTIQGGDDADITYAGPEDSSMVSTVIVNGRVSTQTMVRYTLIYTVTPRKAGTLSLPGLTVVVGGTPHLTAPLSVEVQEVPASSDIAVEVKADATEAYVGQPVRVRVRWILGRDVRGYAFRVPDIDGAEFLPGPSPMPPGTNPNDPRFLRIRFGGEDQACRVDTETINAQQVRVVTIDRVLIPRKPGSLLLPPIRADFNAVVGRRQRGMMDAPWDDLSITERQSAQSASFRFTVRDLPTAGRPADFSGLVGGYKLTAAADQTSVALGDPITLNVRIEGPFPLSSVPPMDFLRQRIAESFRVPRDPVLPDAGDSTATLSAVVRPRSAGVTAIPPITLSYFDPATASYRVAASEVIPITVTPGVTVDLPEELREDRAEARTPATQEPAAAAPHALTISSWRLPESLGRAVRRLTVAQMLVIVAACAAGPLAIGAAVASARKWASSNPIAAARRRALTRARRELARARPESPASVAAVLRRYVAACSSSGAKELTSQEAVAVVSAHADQRCAESTASLLSLLDTACYAPRPDPHGAEPSNVRAMQLTRDLHRAWRSEPRA